MLYNCGGQIRAQGQINPQGESTGRVSSETDDGDASNTDPTEPTLDAWFTEMSATESD